MSVMRQLTVFELRANRYQETAHVSGGQPFEAKSPFPVTVVPTQLVALP